MPQGEAEPVLSRFGQTGSKGIRGEVLELINVEVKVRGKDLSVFVSTEAQSWCRPCRERTPGKGSREILPSELKLRDEERAEQSAADLPGAVKANLPATLAPQLATLATSVPASGEWIYEIKFDGYRLLARIEQGRAAPLHPQRQRLDRQDEAARRGSRGPRHPGSAWLDGEIVVLNEDGMPDFNALQNAFDASRTDSIDYFLFDLPYLDGHDLRHVPLHARRALLKQLVEAKGIERVRFSADFDGRPGQHPRVGLRRWGSKASSPSASTRPTCRPARRPGSSSSATRARSS